MQKVCNTFCKYFALGNLPINSAAEAHTELMERVDTSGSIREHNELTDGFGTSVQTTLDSEGFRSDWLVSTIQQNEDRIVQSVDVIKVG